MKVDKMIVKILKEGDQVLNVWPNGLGYCITVRRQNSEVYVCSIVLDENKVPRIEKKHPLIITFGDDEIETKIQSSVEQNDEETEKDISSDRKDFIKVTTF